MTQCLVQSERMGFYEDLIRELGQSIEKRFDGKPYRLAVAAKTTQIQIDRMVSGERQKHLKSLGKILDAAGLKVVPAADASGPDFVFIKKALARPAAGGGSLETSGETEGGLAFKLEWLRSRTVTAPERLRVMAVDGDSMLPTICHGDIVLVDEGQAGKALTEGRVYVIRKDEAIYVKRFGLGVGEMLFRGDNRAMDYQDVKVRQGDEDGFAVIGRVLWAGKEL